MQILRIMATKVQLLVKTKILFNLILTGNYYAFF
ncbi:hypothetical protein SAMN04489761_2326 [Tenacibaculum sp. MAR_2009_124]|nr:hypothetical protein SAMN04489761_2326 [Tenacibaculum sp. MAR_2009_124]